MEGFDTCCVQVITGEIGLLTVNMVQAGPDSKRSPDGRTCY